MAHIDRNDGTLGRLHRAWMPVEDLANLVAAFAIMGLMCLGVAQIVLRSVFNSPLPGYIDLVELSMASMAFLGAAYCQRLGSHIRMELLIGKLSGRGLWAAEIFGTLVALTIIGVLAWYGFEHFLRSYTLGDTTMDAEYPVWPSKLLVPIAFSIWFVRLSLQLWGSVRLFLDPSKAPVAVVTMKDVAEQAQDEIHEVMGDEADAPEATR
ncbi:TRAP transporter small permease [Jannaschia sp. 2305UL9-9]|uniref:TRAP transporter small permease n=1 Tax=Jannaschia sp. 2305UL9-9 TaxID=3121638 RepID=UPI003528C012